MRLRGPDCYECVLTHRAGHPLLDELPHLTSQLHDAPAALVEALLDALDIQVLYRPEQEQATIWATLTDTTPATITAPLADPRLTAAQTTRQPPAQPGTAASIQGRHKGLFGHFGP